MTVALRRTFSSLAVPNYRRYFAGQVVSVSGNWMQTVAELWLVVKLTHSGLLVGLTPAFQFLPILLFGAWGGLLADRMSKRRLLMVTQTLMIAPALTLFVLYQEGVVVPWMVYALVFVRGCVNAVDNPTRQSFPIELVGPDRLVNAVSLNSVIITTGRIVGPAIAGVVIAAAGVGPCFLLNALSFAAMLAALAAMNPAELHRAPRLERNQGQLRGALRHVAATPGLWIPLGMMVVVGTLSYNFQVLLPLLADMTWHGSATTYATLTTAMGVGALLGALEAGHRSRVSPALLVGAALAMGTVELIAAGAPTLAAEIAALVPLGALTITFSTGVNSSLQLAVDPALRGRIMALYSIVFLGSTPIGAPLVGWMAEAAGPRTGFVLGAVAALVAGIAARAAFARDGAFDAADPPTAAAHR